MGLMIIQTVPEGICFLSEFILYLAVNGAQGVGPSLRVCLSICAP